MNRSRLLERFLRYVKVDTTAQEGADTYPSSPGQLVLGRLVADELRAMGLADVQHDSHGIVLATVPATVRRPVPTIAFCAHLDTSPETTGANVKPQVVENYQGGDLTLRGDSSRVIRVADNPELAQMIGKTLITSDGTTLLGGDDKAGVAVIVEAAQWLLEHPEIQHGPIRLVFTCDEEVGRGVDHLEPANVGAVVCYTLDGHGSSMIDVETFSADKATVRIEGVNIHPSIGKGHMTNAVRVAADFLQRLPRSTLSPETTEGRQGFFHPYEIEGGSRKWKSRFFCGILTRSVWQNLLASSIIRRQPALGSFLRRRSTCESRGNTGTWPRDWRRSLGRCRLPNGPWSD
jgi:tripeptide aminopeptidase